MQDTCVMEDIKKPIRLESYSIFDNQNFSSWLILNAPVLDISYQAVIYDQQVVRKTILGLWWKMNDLFSDWSGFYTSTQ